MGLGAVAFRANACISSRPSRLLDRKALRNSRRTFHLIQPRLPVLQVRSEQAFRRP